MAIPEEVAEALAGFNDKAVFDAWWNAAPRDVVNDTTESGESMLALAASSGDSPWQLNLVRLCLAMGADPNRLEGNGRDTPFAIACRRFGRNSKKIALMLEAGADPNTKIRLSSGETIAPLWYALFCKNVNLEAVVLLLRYGASLDSCRGQQSIEGVLAEEVSLRIRLDLAPWSTYDYGHKVPAMLVGLFAGVRRAGSYARYVQYPLCKDVMFLRSLALRRRAAPPKDPVLAFVCRAPNEIAWHVLGFWRATVDSE